VQVLCQIANPFHCVDAVHAATGEFAYSAFHTLLRDGTSSISSGAFHVRADSLSVMFDVLRLMDAVDSLRRQRRGPDEIDSKSSNDLDRIAGDHRAAVHGFRRPVLSY